MALVTVAELAAALGRDIDDDDPTALAAIARATALVAGELPDWRFEAVTGAELRFAGNYGTRLDIPARNVTDVAAVAVDDTELGADTWAWNGRRTLTRLDGRTWGSPTTTVTVTLDLGEVTAPPVVAAVALQLAGRLATNPDGVRQEGLGGYSVLYDPAGGQLALTADERRLVRQYRTRAFS